MEDNTKKAMAAVLKKYVKRLGLPIIIGASVIVWLVAIYLFPTTAATDIEKPAEVVEEVANTTTTEDDALQAKNDNTNSAQKNHNDKATNKTDSEYESTTADDSTTTTKAKSVKNNSSSSTSATTVTSASAVPAFSGSAYTVINNNVPGFSDSEKNRTDAFETYSDLDSLGRCGVAYANVCKEIMPTTERGAIGSVRPSGWQTVKYNGVVDGNYLYNRCHLIGYQLSGENANAKNLITGTRYLNVEGMLPFENMVDNYVDETNNHVLYRVTPIFEGNNLVASGVQMEAYSVEDDGDGICFNVYCYNVQPGITIDYATGNSALNGEEITKSADTSGSSSKSTSTSSSNKAGSTASKSTSTDSTNTSSTADSNATTPAASAEAPATTTEPTPAQSTEGAYIVNTNNGTLHTASCSHGPEPQNSASYADLASAEAASAAIHGEVKYCGFCMK